ncbi:hypothetical protein [Methylobacterium brachiatum]|jgi:hypothetical protein|uniref:hypothetical protein n=1 Tax=Methylobacterium brachiatum TaxID=269660 RepID=UPI000EFB50DD|nr:hypothetical protein [Methylobacterium brachiatum]AYO83068.1 hypothetical protein EBB05_12875 [Methylobacterium brachiatum]
MLRDGDATFQTTDFLERIGKVKARQRAADDALLFEIDMYEREAAEHTLELVYRHLHMLRQSVQVMHDMPDEEIIPILRAKVLDAGGAEKFVAKVRSLAGIELDPAWIEELVRHQAENDDEDEDEEVQPAEPVSPLLKAALIGLGAGQKASSAAIIRLAAQRVGADFLGEG